MLRYSLRYLRTLFGALADPQVRPYLVAAANLIAVGTVFYSIVEGWDLLDAAYFCVITLATVGFGDLTPVTRLGKVFTMIYIITGLGVLSAFIGAMTRVSIQRTQERHRTPPTQRRWHRHPEHEHETEPATAANPQSKLVEHGNEKES